MSHGIYTPEQKFYVKVSEIFPVLREALASVGYGSKDIQVIVKEQISLIESGGAGRRGFAILVNLTTGERSIRRGSWGGANIFNPENPIDLDDREYEIPFGGAVIKGTEGGTTYATIYIRPENVQPLLGSGAEGAVRSEELSELEGQILNAIGGLTSAGRKNEWERMCQDAGQKATEGEDFSVSYGKRKQVEKDVMRKIFETIDILVVKGLLKKNVAGSVSITTEGKNKRLITKGRYY